jgi:hypothetical protein
LDEAVGSWIRCDAGNALAFAMRNSSLLKAAVSAWAGHDIEAAVAWVQANPEQSRLAFEKIREGEPGNGFGPDPYEHVTAVERLYLEYARQHPLEAERFREKVTDGPLFFQCQMEGMTKEPVEAAAAWVQTLPEERRDAACSYNLTKLDRNQERAFAFCRLCPNAGYFTPDPEVIESEALRDPAALAQFLVSKSGGAAGSPLSRVMEIWREKDPVAAQRYLRTLPSDETQGRLLMESSQILREESQEAAIAWAMTLPHESQRIGAFRCILGDDPSASTGWIDRLPEPAVREALRNPPQAPEDPFPAKNDLPAEGEQK